MQDTMGMEAERESTAYPPWRWNGKRSRTALLHIGISLCSRKARQAPAMPEPDMRILRGACVGASREVILDGSKAHITIG
jgi:hypothetical protein